MILQWQQPGRKAQEMGARVNAEGSHCSCPLQCCVRGLHALPATGVTTWRLEVESARKIEDCFGICNKRFKQIGGEPWEEVGAWIVYTDGDVCIDGDSQPSGVLQRDGGEEKALDVKAGDVLEFTFNADCRTLSLEIEGKTLSPTPVFTDLPKGDFYPIVSCESVRLMHGKKRQRNDALERVAKYARKSWHNRKFCDVDIICSDKRIPCHRSTLAAVSSVFSSMFESGMKESVDREVRVDDTGEVVEALIEFMYTGDLREVGDLGAVLRVADKYDVQELVHVVLETMVRQASPATIVSSIQALKPLLDRPNVADVFEKLLQSVQGSTEMMRAVAMAL